MNLNPKQIKIIFWITVFAIGMGFLESAVVVYLRNIYYPEGFQFPLSPIDNFIAITELLRETATLLMLISIGWIAGKSPISKFAFFIYSFAIWDIYYYVFLKLLLGWPESLLTWDILFLIPVTWVGPVIAPIILSLTMILLAYLIIMYEQNDVIPIIKLREWIILITGSCLLIFGFCLDYSTFLLEKYSFFEIFNFTGNDSFMEYVSTYTPRKFNWTIFILGEIILLSGIFLYYRRNKKKIT
jgi:hypothetical protein